MVHCLSQLFLKTFLKTLISTSLLAMCTFKISCHSLWILETQLCQTNRCVCKNKQKNIHLLVKLRQIRVCHNMTHSGWSHAIPSTNFSHRGSQPVARASEISLRCVKTEVRLGAEAKLNLPQTLSPHSKHWPHALLNKGTLPCSCFSRWFRMWFALIFCIAPFY